MSDIVLSPDQRDITLVQVPGGRPTTVRVDSRTTWRQLVDKAGLAGRDLFADGKPVVGGVDSAIGASVGTVMAVAPTKGN